MASPIHRLKPAHEYLFESDRIYGHQPWLLDSIAFPVVLSGFRTKAQSNYLFRTKYDVFVLYRTDFKYACEGKRQGACLRFVVCPGLSTLTQTASPLAAVVAQRVALSPEAIISNFF